MTETGNDHPTRGTQETKGAANTPGPDAGFSFEFEQQPLRFRSVSDDDHVLKLMRRVGSFYEYEVLLRIRDRLRAGGRVGAAIDAGGFIGTHTVFFSKFCGLRPVLTFEANPATYAVLSQNLESNGVRAAVIAVNKAVGSKPGHATVCRGPETNQGATKVELGREEPGSVPMTTIDAEAEAQHLTDIAMIKIDVEGVEIDALRGGLGVVARHRPVLCIECHTDENLRTVLGLLAPSGYWIVDCLGYSPTYVLEPSGSSKRRRNLVNTLWLWRAGLPPSWSFMRKNLRRWAQRFSTGRWDPPRRNRR